ncbi:hypothetical protein AYO40_04760 [Planctomycetaceae bacterium SCGC AG-212-D15]|nr:hypothetical protein AYO40_04760 [Planctomycetaceae bacterium SCGC AG-212-D15]
MLAKAAAVLLVVAGLGYVATHLGWGSSLAFADVAQKLRDAHTVAYQISMNSSKDREAITMQVYLKEPGWVRMEMPGGVTIARSEGDKYRALSLIPKTHTAILLEQKQEPEAKASDDSNPMRFVERLRNLAAKQGEPAGRKRIGKIEARGFRVKEGTQDWLIWADPETKLPVEIEVTMPSDLHATINEFRFNPRLDDGLFSLEVPKDYHVEPMEIEKLTPEESLVRLLRAYAEMSGGSFPKQLNDFTAILRAYMDRRPGDKPKEKVSPADIRFITAATQTMVFLTTTLKGKYDYRPDGAKLGDADRMIFWYRPAKATKYRALYADLHWTDQSSDQLPVVPKP